MRVLEIFRQNKRLSFFLLGALVLIISFFTYFRNYTYPPNLFWDENYHIASAQKYIEGVFFMEHHPPLGKLLIALGEVILQPNRGIDTSAFLSTDYISEVPQGYSFAGVRFFPALFGMLAAVLFYFILYSLSGSSILSFLFTSLYMFENAFIVHGRGAMLESIQIFFVLLMVWYFLECLKGSRLHLKQGFLPIRYRNYLVLGLLFGLVIAVKLNGATLGILFLALYLYESRGKAFSHPVYRFVASAALFFAGAAFIFLFSYYMHVSLASIPLNDRYYEASQQYRKLIKAGDTSSLLNFPQEFFEHMSFTAYFTKGVPAYDACKPGENGSLPVTWPFGNKSINYRWEKTNETVKYLYLQGNPVAWMAGLVGLVLAFNLLLARLVFKIDIRNKRLFYVMAVFFCIYMLYMGSVAVLPRVMYLYHYFIPLLFSQLLFVTMFLYLSGNTQGKYGARIILAALFIVAAVFITYIFFAPLTYYQPLSASQFQLRNWFPFWGMQPVR